MLSCLENEANTMLVLLLFNHFISRACLRDCVAGKSKAYSAVVPICIRLELEKLTPSVVQGENNIVLQPSIP